MFLFINNYIKRFNLLSNYKNQKHQKFSGIKNMPLSGGIFLTFSILLILNSQNYIFSLFVLLIFFTGFLSDTNLMSSPKLRLLIQLILIILFVLFLEIKIDKINIIFIDDLLNNIYFQYFFSIFCLLVLINGSNFIDGLNGLMLGYFFLILIFVFDFQYYSDIGIDKFFFINLFIVLTYLFILNITGHLFMGDSGSYVLGFITGYFLIELYSYDSEVSPFFIVLLLWYPCFENLFSILRKFIQGKSPANPDDKHFHQLIYYYIENKKKFKQININNFTSFLILFYNFIIFTIAISDPQNTKLQITLIVFNLFLYLVIYLRLLNFKNSK